MGTSNQTITFKGDPMKVEGTEIKVGDTIPDFQLTGLDMADVTYNAFQGKVLVISSVPSLDTPTCALQTKRFNQEAAALSDSVTILTTSRDLPFAMKRWCGAEGVEQVICASDYKHRNFGAAFGVDAVDMGLLARAVFVVDKEGKVAHVEYVDELSEEPNYDEVLAVVKNLL